MPPPAILQGLQYKYVHIGAWISNGHHRVAFGVFSAFFCFFLLQTAFGEGLCYPAWIMDYCQCQNWAGLYSCWCKIKPEQKHVFGFFHSIPVDPLPFTQIPSAPLLQFKLALKWEEMLHMINRGFNSTVSLFWYFPPLILVGEPLFLSSTVLIGRCTLNMYGTEAWVFANTELWLSVNFCIFLWRKGYYLRGKQSQDPMICHVLCVHVCPSN